MVITAVALVVTGASIVSTPLSATTASQGPSTTRDPWVLPVAPGVHTQSLFTVADLTADNGYRMVGIPDGLGAYRQGANMVVYMNHELRHDRGIVRAHGKRGAFVSRLVLDPDTGRVKEGSDLIQDVAYWDYPAGAYADAPGAPSGAPVGGSDGAHLPELNRLCSASLAPAGIFDDETSGAGWPEPLYFANEEPDTEGRVFVVDKDGQAVQLPRVGLLAYENTVPAETGTLDTVLVAAEDDASGQLRVYAGTKQHTGTKADKAGLTNGRQLVVGVDGVSTDAEFRSTVGKENPVRFHLHEVDWDRSGVAQNDEAAAVGLTLNRIEDGHFDPDAPDDFYFATTRGGDTSRNPSEPDVTRDGGGIWRLRFDDVSRPELGGTLTLLLDGSEPPYLSRPDNMTIDSHGNLVIQEDPGNNRHVSRIVAYRLADGARAVVATFDPALVSTTSTRDEETSGIIQVADGSYLLTAQHHHAAGLPPGTGPGTVEELVQHGQLLRMWVPDWDAVYVSGGG